MRKIRFNLEMVTNVALLTTCVIAATVLLRHERQSAIPTADPMFTVGKPVRLVSEDAYSASPFTLLMYVRSGCHYCTDSMPFYRTLRSKQSAAASRLRLVVVSPETREVSLQYLSNHGVTVDGVVSYQAGVPTPAMVLVNSKGIVQKSWVGELNAMGEKEVLGQVNQLGQNGG